MFIAIGLCILQMKKLTLLRWATYGFYLLGWGLPVALATTYFVIVQSPWRPDIATDSWQKWQVFGSVCLHLLCLIVILGALVTLSKIGLSQNTTGVTSLRITSQTESFGLFSRSRIRCNNLQDNGADSNVTTFGNTYYEIIEDPSTDFDGKGEENHLSPDEDLSQVNVRPELLGTENEGADLENCNHQLERHLTLMIVLVASVTVSLVVDVLKLSVGDPYPGVFVLLSILDEILTNGQGIFTLIIFGLKKPKVFTRLYNRICQIYDRLRHRRTGQ
ncbi:hypothetical protein BSL78_20083 [Apostichopus japonicus]|uniref:Uncharacterized protein n=1 Tax=Stichopus japonicus TaxID=307972 RepID=A0A2G8K4X4_STIJA|nr:hypothetical protein BSL78_20083 [Apostichopus japonicus]